MSVQLNWGLDKSIGSALSVARDVFLAANHDNVQPLAIMSCERFGNTIAMCQETCNKVEKLTARTPMPLPIEFLKAYVGFDARDCATQLSVSQAGVQFLGLAAALLVSMGVFEAGSSIHLMLDRTALDKTLLPTARQVKDLLTALEPRLVQSGFLDSVIGWHIFLSNTSAAGQWSNCYPPPVAVASLVEAFRTLSRIGETDIKRVEIRTVSHLPWIFAFTKWCLGYPPSLYLVDGTPVIEQPDSQVCCISDTGINTILKISIIRTLESPQELVDLDEGKEWGGMLTLEMFGKWTLTERNCVTSAAKEALREGAPIAIRKVIECLRFAQYRVFDPAKDGYPWIKEQYIEGPRLEEELISLGLIPFPEDQFVVRTLSRYLDTSEDIVLRHLDDTLLFGLPKMTSHLRGLQNKFPCVCCSQGPTVQNTGCATSSFIDILALVCTDILALSLLSYQNDYLLYLRVGREDSKLQKIIKHIIVSGSTSYCTISDLLHHTLSLLGHDSTKESVDQNKWVMSSRKGQVVFPSIYETRRYRKRGFLALTSLSGILRFNGNEYSDVLARQARTEVLCRLDTMMFPNAEGTAVSGPCIAKNNTNLIWLVETGDGILNVCLGLQGVEPLLSTVECRIDRILEVLASALLLEACPHDENTTLGTPDELATYSTALYPRANEKEKNGRRIVSVVAVDGSDQMRFLTLANAEPVVLRKQSCISCCLKICRRSNYPYLVL